MEIGIAVVDCVADSMVGCMLEYWKWDHLKGGRERYERRVLK